MKSLNRALDVIELIAEQGGIGVRENANLCIRDGCNVIYIDHVSSPDHNLRIFTKLGVNAPLYASGVGKPFLSSLNNLELQQYFQ